MHGPIDCIKVKSKRAPGEDGISVAPAKECPKCQSLIHASIMICPECGHEWPVMAKHEATAGTEALLRSQVEPKVWNVTSVAYSRHVGKQSGFASLCAVYTCGNLRSFTEYVPIEDERPFIRKRAVNWMWARGAVCPKTVSEALAMKLPTPVTITVIPDGKYQKITKATFNHT